MNWFYVRAADPKAVLFVPSVAPDESSLDKSDIYENFSSGSLYFSGY